MSDYSITLIDGRVLPCELKGEQPADIKTDELQLDTTGAYLSFGNRKPKVVSEDLKQRASRQYDHHIFTENAWFLLQNAEKILSDSKMFLAPVRVQNGLAYSGTSGFARPTIGVYLEWWLNHKDAAIDKNGNLVWYISGSPLSGSNCCSSVTSDGEQVKIAQHTSFSAIWRSFIEVNTRYTEAKQRCEAYTLEEVIIKLRGEDYKYRIIDLQHEMIEMVMDWERNPLEKAYHALRTKMDNLVKANRRNLLRQNRDSILKFYEGYMERQQEIDELEKVYTAEHRRLKEQLRSGALERDYKRLLAEASREYKAKKREQSEILSRFITETFGKNPNHITPSDIIRFASGKPLKFNPFY